MSAEASAFATSLVVNGAVAVVMFSFFCAMRTKYPTIFAPRTLPETFVGNQSPAAKLYARPAPLPAGFLAWLAPTLALTDDQVFEMAGLDALMYTVFFRVGFKIFMLCAPYALVVLLLVNSYGNADGETGLNALTMSNIDAGESLLWAHAISAYMFCIIAMVVLTQAHRLYAKYRTRFFSGRPDQRPLPHIRSVLVTDLPPGTTSQSLAEYFSRFYPDVTAAHVVHDVSDLRKLTEEREKLSHELEHTNAVIAELRAKEAGVSKKQREMEDTPLLTNDLDPELRPKQRVGGLLCIGGQKVDKQEHLQNRLTELNAEIETLQRMLRSTPSGYCAGIVTFASAESSAKCIHATHSPLGVTYTTDFAPETTEVVWDNLRMGYKQRTVRSMIVGVALVLLVVFWAIPVAAVSALTSLEALSKNKALSFLAKIAEANAAIRGFLQGFLPTLALIVFMALLPLIMTAMSKAEGITSISRIREAVLSKLFYFQIVNVFFVSLIAGSFFKESKAIIDKPSSIISLLGSSVPASGFFFTNYVMLQALGVFAMQMSRIVPWIVSRILLRFLCKTEYERRQAEAPGDVNYGVALPAQILVFVIGFTYASVAPIIIPFVILFYGLGYVVTRYQLVYVNIPTFESGGRIWPIVFQRIVSGLIIYQITLIGIMSLKKAKIQAPLLVPLPILTVLWAQQVRKFFEDPLLVPPVSCAADSDSKSSAAVTSINHEPAPPTDDSTTYIQPELIEPPVDVEAIMRQDHFVTTSEA